MFLQSLQKMIDTTDTRYNNTEHLYQTELLCDWTVKCQPGLSDHHPTLRQLLQADLLEIRRLLPSQIVKIMKEVIIFINISYRYPGHSNNILGACLLIRTFFQKFFLSHISVLVLVYLESIQLQSQL